MNNAEHNKRGNRNNARIPPEVVRMVRDDTTLTPTQWSKKLAERGIKLHPSTIYKYRTGEGGGSVI